MDKILSPIKQRILQYIDYKRIIKESFYEKTSISASNFKSVGLKSEIGGDKIANILSIYTDIDPEWLLTGNGTMLKDIVNEIDKKEIPSKGIPLVLPTAVGGFGNSNFAIEQRDVKEYYVIPKFKHKKIDFMIEVEGSSMYPKYNSGDVVACRIINENSFIQWNKTHVIATKDQGIIIKRIKKGNSDNNLLFVSDNSSYDPFEVSKEDITGIALVVGVIRLE